MASGSAPLPLHQAIDDGDFEQFRLLLDTLGIGINAQDDLGRTPLHAAIDLLAELVANPPDADEYSASVNKAKDFLVQMGDNPPDAEDEIIISATVKVVSMLLSAGANPNIHAGPDGLTPLHDLLSDNITSLIENTVLIQELFDSEIELEMNAPDNLGRTPFYELLHNGYADSALVKIAIKECTIDLNIKVPQAEGRTLFHELILKRGDDLALAQAAIARGAILNTQDEHGRTPLHDAVTKGNVDVVLALIQAGADSHARDHSGSTPLHEAAASGNVAMISAVMSADASDADLNKQDEEGCTPLYRAAAAGHADAVSVLIKAGAGAVIEDARGRSPLDAARIHGHTAAQACLLAKVGVPETLAGPRPSEEVCIAALADFANIACDARQEGTAFWVALNQPKVWERVTDVPAPDAH